MGLIQHIRLANPVVSILVPVYKVPENASKAVYPKLFLI